MAITLVQSPIPAANTGAPLTSLAQAFPVGNVLGNLLICSVILIDNGTPDTIAVADTLVNSYQALSAQVFGGTNLGLMQTFYVLNCKAGTNTITATFTGGNTTAGVIIIREFGGLTTVDAQAFAAGSALSVSSGNATTIQPTELIYGVVGVNIRAGAITGIIPGAGFTSINGSSGSLTTPGFIDEYQISSSAGATAATATITLKSATQGWGAQMVTFFGPAAGQPRVHTQLGRSGYGPHSNWQGPVG